MLSALLLLAAAPAPAEAVIQGFGRQGFQDRRADGTRGLYVQAITGRWYYARFARPCGRLPAAGGITFEPSPIDRLDKDSGIVAEGEVCRFVSLVESGPPPRKRRR